VARERLSAVVPGADRVLGRPPPDGGVSDRFDGTSGTDYGSDLRDAEARQSETLRAGKLALLASWTAVRAMNPRSRGRTTRCASEPQVSRETSGRPRAALNRNGTSQRFRSIAR
jgi:hypothetical protein